ncbi:catecholate siderophore receptor Fiu [Dyella ginsengisoli]|uniref:Catecholate siderophore receptor Fiu n=1 Tax=Dyella ginsengisoli TaxID=363848 RepID=A0ABW8JTS8_9GAMM
MAFITSRKHALPTTAALLTGLALAPSLVMATDVETTAQVSQARSLPGLKVEANRGPDYRVDELSSPKYTQPLLDTAQTVQVIGRDLIEQQGATTLTEALRNSPGVGTFYAGENGTTTTGDGITMRGFDTSGSIFVDGVRDLGSYSRDVFNLEQIEVTKGPDGTTYGRTAPTGAINLVSKQPMASDALSGSIAYGSATQRRATADWNETLSPTAAFRLDVLGQDSGVPGRDDVRNKRWGVAPSLAFGLKTATRVYLDALHVTQHNRPDGGVPTIGLPGYGTPDPTRPFLDDAAPVDPSNFYGTLGDHDDVRSDMLTAIVQHDFSPDVTLQNTARWARTHQDYQLISYRTTAANLLTPEPSDPTTWTITRDLPTFKDQTNRILTNQTNLRVHAEGRHVDHDLSLGVELTREEAGAIGQAALGGSKLPAANLYAPDADVGGLLVGRTGARSRGVTRTAAVYAFDTLSFGERWKINAGARFDHYTTDFESTVLCGARNAPACGNLPAATPVTGLDTRTSGNLPNYKLGVLYKPAANGSIYVNVAQSQEPPGGNTLTLSSAANSADNPSLDPQKARTVEVGSKWDVLAGKLLLTGALYRTTVSNELVQDPVDQQYYQIGRKRVQGVELGAVGRLTEHWAISAGFTTMDATVLKGAVVSSDGSRDLAYTPKQAFTSWTTYRWTSGLTLGGGARYVGGLKRGTDGAIGTPTSTEAYWVFDAVASLPVNQHLSVQLNLYNLFDKRYVAAINKSGYRYTPGTPRSAMLTANFRF